MPLPTWGKPLLVPGLVTLALLWGMPAAALRTISGTNVVVRENVDDDLAVAGNSVAVLGRVSGDLLAAGSIVRVEGPVGGSALVTGTQVTVAGPVEGSLYAAGQSVTVTSRTGRNAYMAGEMVLLEQSATVGRDAVLAAMRGQAQGDIGGRLWASGQSLRLGGRVGDSVRFAGAMLVLGPAAHIGGNVYYRQGADIQVADTAVIGGRLIAQPAPAAPRAGLGFWRIVMAIGLLIVALVLALLVPAPLAYAAESIARRPGLAFALGVAIIIGGAIASTLVFITLVGIPLALVMWTVWGLWLYLANVVVAAFVGGGAARTFRRSPSRLVAATALGVLILVLLGFVPILGTVVRLLVWSFGVGAIAMTAYWLARGRPAAAVTAPVEAPAAEAPRFPGEPPAEPPTAPTSPPE